MSLPIIQKNKPDINNDYLPSVIFDSIRTADIPISIQGLLALKLIKKTKVLLWIASNDEEMQKLIETINTFKDSNQLVFPFAPATQDPTIIAQHIRLLTKLNNNETTIILTSPHALSTNLPDSDSIQKKIKTIKVGDYISPEQLADWLNENGYDLGVEVYSRGEASRRGSIIDCWPPESPRPMRIDFFGNEIDSIRYFDDQSQCSIENITNAELTALELSSSKNHTIMDCLPDDRIIVNPLDPTTESFYLSTPYKLFETKLKQPSSYNSTLQAEKARLDFVNDCCMRINNGESFYFYFETKGTYERFKKLYGHLNKFDQLNINLGVIHESAHNSKEKVTLITENDFYAYNTLRSPHSRNVKRFRNQERVNEVADIQPGDYVVHVEHGIGKYLGLAETKSGKNSMEVLTIEYAKGDKVYLPVTQAHLLTRYKSLGKHQPRLHNLGGKKWINDRSNAEEGAHDLAVQLLETQAIRQNIKVIPSNPDTGQQAEFESSFPYTETEDQLHATSQIKSDMEKKRPMDRLLCGDVGFGKTEVAMRCAFKAVQNGRQVAILVPTTVLTQQHYNSFNERMAPFAVSIDMMCRLRNRKQQNETLKNVITGKLDILIGTHRILSNDVKFKDLGLLIIDEEQRFGVNAKEKLKSLRKDVDIITMSATPIPRTLYMSLTGIRDLATIKTAPQERQPVETHVVPYNEEIITEAIEQEIKRGGQCFYLHNRVKSIHTTEAKLRSLLPNLKIAVAHGQMEEKELSEIMYSFVARKYDILICTTIIESGVDIPNCNTLLVENAERFGLSDLYQLRGRVGRSSRKSFAYFMLTEGSTIIDAARDRLNAIQRYTGLGSGFRLAMRDLEMRGAGNLLGAKQSGHISNVGFELYCQLLKRTIAIIKGNLPPPFMDVSIQCDFLNFSPSSNNFKDGAFIPYDYIEDENLRLRIYQKISAIHKNKEIQLIKKEIRDRFGPLPTTVHRLLLITQIRIKALKKGISAITIRNNHIMLKTNKGFVTKDGQHLKLRSNSPNNKLKELLKLI